MSKSIAKDQRRNVSTLAARDGEGVMVDLIPNPARSVDGRAGLIQGDIHNLPVPNKRYAADICSIVSKNSVIKLLFAQEKIGPQALRNMIIVNITPRSVTELLKKIDDVKDISFAELAALSNIEAEALPQIEVEPAETASLNANLILVAASGTESCIDFFHSSAFSIAFAQQTSRLGIDPVVRVNIRTSLLMGLIEELRNLISINPDIFKDKRSAL